MFKQVRDNAKVRKILALAKDYGWERAWHNPDNFLISIFRGSGEERIRVDIYYTTMTIGTALKHPLKGKTQLFRRNVDDRELLRILKNPRLHSGKGYYTKHLKDLNKLSWRKK